MKPTIPAVILLTLAVLSIAVFILDPSVRRSSFHLGPDGIRLQIER